MKFLIVKLSSLGDIIHTLPIVHVLRENYPLAQIDWLVGKKGFELLSLIKELDNIYLPTLKDLSIIQKQNYDYVIDVQGLFKSAFLSKISFGKSVIGFEGAREFANIFYDKKINVGDLFKTKKHIVDLNLELISFLNQNQVSNSIKFLIPKINKSKDFQITRPSIAIFPATTWESKLWPMNYWFELIKEISKDFKVYLCASNTDLPVVEDLLDKLDLNQVVYKNLVGKTAIKDLIYLIQNVGLVIGLDSAPLHLASAIKNDYGYPELIGIFGPTSPKRNGPYNSPDSCLYLSELECIACRKKVCPLGHHACMNNIVPSFVRDMIYSCRDAVNRVSLIQ